jgi:pyruvate/2-oxoglutarate dehydrogenase complex dihydrolipoamide acyltransferase (E2) component
MSDAARTWIRIPQAGVAMTEGTITEWLVAEGAHVLPQQPLYVLETEKVEMEVECPAAGILHITGATGVTYPVGEPVGYIEDPG